MLKKIYLFIKGFFQSKESATDPIKILSGIFKIDSEEIKSYFLKCKVAQLDINVEQYDKYVYLDGLGATSFFFLLNMESKNNLLSDFQNLGFLIQDVAYSQKIESNNSMLLLKISQSRVDYIFNILTNNDALVEYLSCTSFEISPPWIYFPDARPMWLDFHQGEKDYWYWVFWEPFWSKLSFVERYDYLRKYRADQDWFDLLTEYELMEKILFYRKGDAYGEFSNFSAYPIMVDGLLWPTVEHYFQANKFQDPIHIENIRNNPNPMVAAKIGRVRHDSFKQNWDLIRDDVMCKALYAKFTQHDSLKQLLLNTEGKELIEHTTNDSYWADGIDGFGRNKLGCFLMDLRYKFKNQLETES